MSLVPNNIFLGPNPHLTRGLRAEGMGFGLPSQFSGAARIPVKAIHQLNNRRFYSCGVPENLEPVCAVPV